MTVQQGASAFAGAVENVRFGSGRRHFRPAPADFVEMARKRGIYGLKEHYRTGQTTILRWYAETGAVQIHRCAQAIPDDLAQLCTTMHQSAIAQHFGVSPSTVRRWLDAKKLEAAPPPPSIPRRPIPEDFAQVAPTMTRQQLRDHYRASEPTICRWVRETCVTTRSPAPWRRTRTSSYSGPRAAQPTSDGSVEALAAQHLRRTHIVYRCDVLPRAERAKLPNEGRGFWYVNGKGALPAEQMVDLAKSKGFDPDAWARI